LIWGKRAGDLIEGGGVMNFLEMASQGVLPTDALTGLAYGIIKILAYSAMGVVFAGIVMTCWCDLFECRKWRRCQGRTEVWRLMH
jgi:hypothetical protein